MRTLITTILLGVGMAIEAEVANFAQVEVDDRFDPTATTLWDFSDAEIIKGQVNGSSITFGDSLMIERYPVLRLVFVPQADGLRLMREESPNSMINIPDTFGVCLYTQKRNPYDTLYSASGIYAGRWRTEQHGICTAATSASGTLVLCDGDTVRGIMCQSLVRQYSSALDSTQNYKGMTAYYRWIRADEPMPYAFMAVSKLCNGDGTIVYASNSTYLRRLNTGEGVWDVTVDEDVSLPTPDDLADWLCHMSVSYGSDTISVTLPDSDEWGIDPRLPVVVTVTDERGVLYATANGCCGDSAVSIPCSGLYPGHYLVAVTIPDAVSATTAKRLVTVR